MLKIRLSRTGRSHQLSYRVVVKEARSKRNGRYLENLGFYNPVTKELKINKKRWQYWQERGAQPTQIARRLYEKAS